MRVTKEEIYGYTGSGIFCLLIILLLFLIVIRTTVKAGEEGILVSFGNVNLASGTFEPKSGEPQNESNRTPPIQQPAVIPETRPAVQPRTQNNTPPAVTQNTENTAAIETARREQEERNRREAEQQAQRAIEEAALQAQRDREAEEQRRRDAINQRVLGALGSAANGQNQRGLAEAGSGIQGDSQSTTTAGSPSGNGYGEFNLNGRTLGTGGLPRPAYSVQEEGRIVLNITVDPNGNVIFAEIGRGTNIDNATLRNSAREAALKAKFNRISGNNNQSGTITYGYRLQ